MNTSQKHDSDELCTVRNRRCVACQNAAGMRARPVFVTDDDEYADYLRDLGNEWIKRMLKRPA